MTQKIYKFSAKWCMPCKQFAPIFDSVMEKYKDKFEIHKVDVDNCTEEDCEIMKQNHVSSIPTTIMLDENNNVTGTLLGVFSEKELTDIIEKTINS